MFLPQGAQGEDARGCILAENVKFDVPDAKLDVVDVKFDVPDAKLGVVDVKFDVPDAKLDVVRRQI